MTRTSSHVRMDTVFRSAGGAMLILTAWTAAMRKTVAVLVSIFLWVCHFKRKVDPRCLKADSQQTSLYQVLHEHTPVVKIRYFLQLAVTALWMSSSVTTRCASPSPGSVTERTTVGTTLMRNLKNAVSFAVLLIKIMLNSYCIFFLLTYFSFLFPFNS